MSIAVAEKIAGIVHRIETGETLDVKLRRIIEHEIRRRLAEYEAMNRRFCTKYGMTLEDFERMHMLEKSGYSFEVENDYHDWDMAEDGIASLRRELRMLIEETV